MILREVLLQAIARGWCHESTSDRQMDTDLAVAISEEVWPLVQVPQQHEHHWVAIASYPQPGDHMFMTSYTKLLLKCTCGEFTSNAIEGAWSEADIAKGREV